MTLASLLPVAAASLLGSLHCAAMCGGFVAAYAGSDGGGKRRWLPHLAYNLGRLVTYSLLGAVAGAAGRALDLAGQAAGLAHAAAIVAGLSLISLGLFKLVRTERFVRIGFRAPSGFSRLPVRLLASFAGKPPVVRSALLGLSSTLLPCGWLYAFAAVAAGTASALHGAAVMAAFWLGSVPALLGVGLSIQALAAPLRKHVPRLGAALLVTAGLVTLFTRIQVPIVRGGESASSAAHPEGCPFHDQEPAR